MVLIERAKNGENTLLKDGNYLLSRYNPRKDVWRYLSHIPVEENYFYILFGSTLGYISDGLIEKGVKEENILVYEIEDLPIDYSLNRYQRVSIFNNVFSMSALIEQKLKEQKKPYVLCLESYKKVYDREFEDFSIALKKIIQVAVENIKVSAFFSKVWFINFFRNLSMAYSKANFYYLGKGNLLQEFPVLVLASGPSLDDYINKIKDYQKKFIIMAVLSAVPSLLKNGLEPDFVLISDGGVYNKLHGHHILENIPIFASIYASSAFLSGIKNPVVYYDFAEEINNPSFQLKYPSVTIDAGLIAKAISNRVIFVGFDLAHSIKKGSHCSKTVFMCSLERNNSKYNSPYSNLTSFLRRSDLILLDGDGICSNRQFYMVKELSEKLFGGFEYIRGGVFFNTLKALEDFNFVDKYFLDKKEAIKNTYPCFKRDKFFLSNIKNSLMAVIKKFEGRDKDFLSGIFMREKIGNIDIEPIVEYYEEKVGRIHHILSTEIPL